jgi:hypothetical protein
MKKNTTMFLITIVKEPKNCITKTMTPGRKSGTRSNFKNSKNINKNTKEAVNNRFFCVNKYAKSVNKHVDNL